MQGLQEAGIKCQFLRQIKKDRLFGLSLLLL
jgi:hypothetical protein